MRCFAVVAVTAAPTISLHAQEIINVSWSGSAYTVHGPDANDAIAVPEYTLLAAEDLSGDGVSDLVITSLVADGPGNTRTDSGEVHVIFGPFPDGEVRDLATRPGDVTIYGREATGLLGYGMAIADLDGDGSLDLALGAPNSRYLDTGDTGRGEVAILFGPFAPGAIDLALVEPGRRIIGRGTYDALGTSLAVGDVNEDGTDDLVMGCMNSPVPGVGWAGSVKVLFGPIVAGPIRFLETAPPDVLLLGNEDSADFARRVEVGDVSGDGVADIVVAAGTAASAAGAAAAGRVIAIFGPLPSGTTFDLRTTPADLVVEGADPVDELGASLLVKDVDGNGVDDVILGVPGADGIGNLASSAGEAHVVLGPVARGAVIDNLTTFPDVRFTADASSRIGRSLVAAPLPDGRTRIVLSAPNEEDCGHGAMYVVDDLPPRGSYIDLKANPPPLTVTSGDANEAGLDMLLADLTGDTMPELLFGAMAAGPAGDRLDAGALYVMRPDDRCESAPLGLGPHGIDVRRVGDDVLIDFDGAGLGEDSIGVDVYRGRIDTWRSFPRDYDHEITPNGCGVPAPPYRDAGAAAPGIENYYYLATRGCPDACGPYRMYGDLGFDTFGAPREPPSTRPWIDALTCR